MFVVGIGGGTGLPVVLRAIATAPGVEATAIVAVSDNGGSSGRLRRSLNMPAVGDLRNCLVALSENGSLVKNLFQHRFSKGDVQGHSLGNLIVAALYQQTGSLAQALDTAGNLLLLKGRALACTEVSTALCAMFQDGTVVRGECEISKAGKQIECVWLEPAGPKPSPGVLEAIHSANAIVLAPGSLYTSLLPNLLVAGVANAIRESGAAKILVCNLMTQPGETDGFSASDHLRVVESVLGRGTVDFCIVNSEPKTRLWQHYRAHGSEPVLADVDVIRAMGAVPVEASLATVQRRTIRHNASRLGRVLLRIARTTARNRAALQAA
ncbi:MAG: YvcK family protein [Bryobacterales bacterium]|nr:YvcK family protein [Bryobacterales bacterium]MBV9401760.1 YvcK family protein [Bryobacterales bacterium]